jgi:outer membrane lipoprotein SlyB
MGNALAQRAGQSISVQPGVVIGAQAVNLQSEAGRGAAIGGIVGYAATSSTQRSSRRARNTFLGALAGAAITRGAEGNLDGMKFTVETGPGASTTVVTDQTEIQVGDCVNVEQAGSGTTNVRRVSQSLCDSLFNGDLDEDSPGYEEIEAYMTAEADRCLQAKERMMEAETDEAFEVAMRRVKFFCDD